MNIIVVEDDAKLGMAIKRALEHLAYTVTWLRTGAQGLEALRNQSVDLVLLDLGLPEKDGIEVITEARRLGVTTPILVMTARDSVEARVRGLDAGADDYMTKPFHLDELSARVRSLARRAQGLADNRLESGALSLNLSTLDVIYRDDHVVLTRREIAVLRLLMERQGKIVSRESIESSVYGLESEVSPNALEVLVHSIRRKISPGVIQTVRGFGYMVPRDLS